MICFVSLYWYIFTDYINSTKNVAWDKDIFERTQKKKNKFIHVCPSYFMSNSPNILLSHNIRKMWGIQVPQVLRFPRYWVLFSSIFAEAGWLQGSFPTTVLRRLLLSATDWHATAVFLWRNWFYYFHWTEPWLNSTFSLHSSQRYSWFTPLGVYDSSTENLAVIKFIIINTLFHMKRAFGTIGLKQAWK